jgi:squalene monooxygenase
VIYHAEPVKIPYPAKELSEKGEKPEGRSFHHGRFVQKLREAAIRTPNVTVVESTVTDVVKDDWTGQILGVKSTTRGEQDFVRYSPPFF